MLQWNPWQRLYGELSNFARADTNLRQRKSINMLLSIGLCSQSYLLPRRENLAFFHQDKNMYSFLNFRNQLETQILQTHNKLSTSSTKNQMWSNFDSSFFWSYNLFESCTYFTKFQLAIAKQISIAKFHVEYT